LAGLAGKGQSYRLAVITPLGGVLCGKLRFRWQSWFARR
jgi:hypothetical protein